MYRRKSKRNVSLLSLLAAIPLLTFPPHAISQETPQSQITIASWNVRILSNRSRDAEELGKIADLFAPFDLVAVQEARDTHVLDRLVSRLPGWTYVASPPVGRGVREIYAFFWRRDAATLVGAPHVVGDPGDAFIREPYAATFRAGEFDFTLCTIHLLYGNSKTERRRELVLMDELVDAVQQANGQEQDVILLGDFNFPPTDRGWQLPNWTALFLPPLKTTIGDKSLYDNIWIDPTHTTEYAGSRGMVRFDERNYGGDLRRASLEVSDHRPIWATFRTDRDDDPDEYGDLSRAVVAASPGIPSAVESRPSLETRPAPAPSSTITVYVTRTGKKYHRSDCSYLRRSRIPMSLEDAKRRYGPCSRCSPPR